LKIGELENYCAARQWIGRAAFSERSKDERMAQEGNRDVVVVGGAAGAAIAYKLAEQGGQVTLLFRDDILGATDTNQKWLHSGLLYPSYGLASKAWKNRNADWVIKERYLKGPWRACILALNQQTIIDRTKMWAGWRAEGHEVPIAEPLTLAEEEHLRQTEIELVGG
jgi:glycine/D-amino acid oxidase-like deaminating enzyme